jgi:multicomponent Na+:H+ antiporter subunit D
MHLLILVPVLLPLLAGGILPLVVSGENHYRKRQIYVSTVLILNTLLVLFISFFDVVAIRIMNITNVINIYLQVDNISRFFVILASFMWLLVSFFAFEYIKPHGRDNRFFTFYLLAYGAIVGACLAGNFFTLYLFYELITLFTFPFVVHFGTKASLRAGAKYLMYSFFGAALIMVGFVFLANYGSTTDFIPGGALDPIVAAGNETMLLVVFLIAFVGFATKAYIWPLFDWVPVSYPETPSPGASLLSGVVSKVAILAIIRLTFYGFGWEFVYGSWVQTVLICIILFTVFAGSMLAYKEKLFKRRLAYSSVSQLSYVLFGIILLNPVGFLGAMLHVLFHGIIKVTLFLSAGAVIHQTDKRYVHQLRGVGKAMPITMWCFTIAAVSLVGIPPTAGFISKWYLAMGGISSSYPVLGVVGAGILLISALLTGGYLITIFANAFFPGSKFDYDKLEKTEAGKSMTIPLIILATLCVFLGVFSGFIIEYIERISSLIF